MGSPLDLDVGATLSREKGRGSERIVGWGLVSPAALWAKAWSRRGLPLPYCVVLLIKLHHPEHHGASLNLALFLEDECNLSMATLVFLRNDISHFALAATQR